MFIVIGGLTESESGKRPFHIEFYNVTCNTHDALCKRIECDVTRLGVSRYAINVMYIMGRELPTNAEIRFLIHAKPSQGRTAIKFVDVKMNICSFLKNGANMPLLNDIMDKLRRSSNIPLSCPVKANYMYNITKAIITDELFPIYTPIAN
uniref:MD-2-related lipid-recognition domain-containing protein n=1 Tax=Stomoxys calcitrans TaxID=35570 RepID=A0A1I8NM70_STOCA